MRAGASFLDLLGVRKPPVLDTAKIALMFNRARGTRTFAFVVLASTSGCRRRELLALEWADINFDADLMMVSKPLEQTKAGLRIKNSKSEEPREIGLPDHALDVLREHREKQDRDRAYTGKATRITIWSSANPTALTTRRIAWALAWRNCCARPD